ncbi:MAG TPA: imidazole glycerol phosphate synthase subunit HisH [Gemmatimonadaceae bacterium]|nr:imidazole glycerol phosphate synthase subunit HisH [Gemmatimonadaceae bacterium]
MTRVTIFDYGAGNLHSLAKALARDGVSVAVACDPRAALRTDVLVLPGVGNFSQAASCLTPARDAMRDAIRDGLPTLGVCLGMQLLFESSTEGPGSGLGVVAGRVSRLAAFRVPHIGWNTIDDARDPLFRAAPLPAAYFANGYACRPDDETVITAWTTHDRDRFPAVVRARRALGVQFHPEKSSCAGVQFVRAFLAEVAQ